MWKIGTFATGRRHLLLLQEGHSYFHYSNDLPTYICNRKNIVSFENSACICICWICIAAETNSGQARNLGNLILNIVPRVLLNGLWWQSAYETNFRKAGNLANIFCKIVFMIFLNSLRWCVYLYRWSFYSCPHKSWKSWKLRKYVFQNCAWDLPSACTYI